MVVLVVVSAITVAAAQIDRNGGRARTCGDRPTDRVVVISVAHINIIVPYLSLIRGDGDVEFGVSGRQHRS